MNSILEWSHRILYKSEHGSEAIEHFTFEDLMQTFIFLTMLWFIGKGFEYFKLPALVGEIAVGCIIGPPLLDWVPNPTAFMLFGEIGLILLVVEAGLEVDLLVLQQVGLRGLIIGVIGSFIPLGIGFGIALLLRLETNAALACGACFAPTSMGVAVIVMKKKNVLNTPVGQLIVASAVIDDIVALVILSELQALSTGQGLLGFFIPILSAVGFSLVIGSIAIKYMPGWLKKDNFKFIPDSQYEHSMLGLLLVFLIALMAALHYGKSSHLLGAFLAGLCFCTIKAMENVWHHQIKKIMKWLLRIFFGCSVGFQVPIRTFWTAKVLGMGFAFCLALSGKLSMGLLADPFTAANIYTVGLAMSTWGEFAFIIAVSGKAEGLLDEDQFAAVILAVLLSVVFMPLALSNTIEYYHQKTRRRLSMAIPHSSEEMKTMTENEKDDAGHIYYKLDIRVKNKWGVLTSVIHLLQCNNLEMIEFFTIIEHGYVVYEAYIKDKILKDSDATTAGARGLEDRIDELEALLLNELMKFDTETIISHEVEDLSHLHGFCIVRWLPTQEDEVDWVEFSIDEKKALMIIQDRVVPIGRDRQVSLSARDYKVLYSDNDDSDEDKLDLNPETDLERIEEGTIMDVNTNEISETDTMEIELTNIKIKDENV